MLLKRLEKIKDNIEKYSAIEQYNYIVENIDEIIEYFQKEKQINAWNIAMRGCLTRYKKDGDYRKICLFLYHIGLKESSEEIRNYKESVGN